MSRNLSPLCTFATVVLVASLTSCPAAADEDIPTYKVLSCEHDCPAFVAAKALSRPAPDYPREYMADVPVEALVDVDYTVGVDGTVKSPVVEFLLGPLPFATNALSAVRRRMYQPATENGVPVEENHRVRYMFRATGMNVGARTEAVGAYGRAIRLAKDGKIVDAIAGLNALASRPTLNFYERTMIAYALATLEMAGGDYWSGRSAIRIATIDDGHFLDKRVVDNALRLRIKLEALNGEFAESFTYFELLSKSGPIKDDDPIAQLVQRLHASIASSAPLAIDARIPVAGDVAMSEPALWHHTLLRRSFEFSHVEGKLDHFDLLCERHSIRSAVSEKADWTVPASWTGCNINVYGAANTKFQFVEMQPAPP